MRHRLAVALAFAVLLAGCGGEETADEGAAAPSPQPTATPSPAPSATQAGTINPEEWSQKVVRLCEANRRKAEKAVARLTKRAQAEGQSQTEFAARVLEYSAEVGRPQIDKLEAVPLPEGREREAKRFVSLLKDTLPLLEDSAKALRDKDRAESAKINKEILDVALPARKLARELDVQACNAQAGQGP